MKRTLSLFLLLFTANFLLPGSVWRWQTETSPASHRPASVQKAEKKGPSPQQIAEAQAQGLVWVNTATRVYHKDGPLYGTTELGKFMKEEDAQKAGYRIASKQGHPNSKHFPWKKQ